jgi:hypothetical protein
MQSAEKVRAAKLKVSMRDLLSMRSGSAG